MADEEAVGRVFVRHEPMVHAVWLALGPGARHVADMGSNTARVLDWNGRDVPREFLELPSGQYIIE